MAPDTETAGSGKMLNRKISLKGIILVVYGIIIASSLYLVANV